MKRVYFRIILVGFCSSVLLISVANPVSALFFPEEDVGAKEWANALADEAFPDWRLNFYTYGKKSSWAVFAGKGDWQKRQITPYFHHVGRKAWKGFFFLVDSLNRNVYKVTGGMFGKPGGTRKLTNIQVIKKRPPLAGADPEHWVDNNEPLTRGFGLLFPSSFLIHSISSRETIIKNNVGPVVVPKGSLAESYILLRNWDLVIERVKPYYFYITTRVDAGAMIEMTKKRWGVNTSRKVVYREEELRDGWHRKLDENMLVKVSGDPKNPTVFSVKLPDLTLGIQ